MIIYPVIDFDFDDEDTYGLLYDDCESGEEDIDRSSSSSQLGLHSTSQDTLLQSAGIDGTNKNMKRKRHRKPNKRYPVAPRILRHDIRRQYARMYVNVMNSSDPSLLLSFFKRYGSHNPVMKNNVNQPGHIAKKPFSMEIQGRDVITWFIAAIQQLFPDKASSYDNVVVRTTHGSLNSTIECDFKVDHTVLYDVAVDEFLQETLSLLAIADEDEQDRKKKKYNSEDDVAASAMKAASPFSKPNLLDIVDPLKLPRLRKGYIPLVSNPISVHVQGKLVLHVDEHHRIYEVEFTGQDN